MALTDQNNMVMPVAPMYGGGNMGGFGGFGGDGWWLILLLLCFNGGWGGFGGFGGMGAAMMDGGFGLYPWLNNSQNINGGFRDQMLNSSLNGIQNSVTSGFGDVQNALCSGFGGVQNALCSGFAGVNATVNGAQNALAQQMYTNQIADLERSFAAQTANSQGLNAIQGQLAQCCCDNRLATNDVKYTIATEACSTRATDTQNTQASVNAINDGFKAMSDQRYQDKIDAKNDEIAQLRQENLYARGQASQIAQDQRIVDGIYNRLATCPVDTTPVFGRSPIFTCATNLSNTNIGGCGCGCGA
jgi:hypothetical protein